MCCRTKHPQQFTLADMCWTMLCEQSAHVMTNKMAMQMDTFIQHQVPQVAVTTAAEAYPSRLLRAQGLLIFRVTLQA